MKVITLGRAIELVGVFLLVLATIGAIVGAWEISNIGLPEKPFEATVENPLPDDLSGPACSSCDARHQRLKSRKPGKNKE
jgi:hypothetical protein